MSASAETELRGWLVRAVAEVTGAAVEEVDVDQPLAELGLSSRDAVVLAGTLGDHLHHPVAPTVLWQHPTITRLARHLTTAGAGLTSDTGPVGGGEAGPAGGGGAAGPAGGGAAGPAGGGEARPAGGGAAGPAGGGAAGPAGGGAAGPAGGGAAGPAGGGEAGPAGGGGSADFGTFRAGATDSSRGRPAWSVGAPWDDGDGGRRPAPEPIAVVGVGCRLPGGVTDPEELWRFLRAGGDGIGPVPADRWVGLPPGVPRWGGFLADIRGFDAEFFGISPREAAAIDPQQRLVLEVSWEALQHAGIAPASLRGSRTGVFVGISTGEYGAAQAVDPRRVEPWTATGSALSVAANRVSYLLDLRGPSAAVDTACSSSLVAVHHAVRSLRSGETDAAVVAGVNVLLGGAVTAAFARAGLLAADGRCKPFSASADGIARAEGCAAVVLKRVSDARRDGDRVLAVIRASAVNSDGRSNGLMAPNPAAQAALLREVYAEAGVDPAAVDYVEAHGTGTLLGDPIEAGALDAVLGAGRAADRPLLVGSAKSNFGHTEAAAGLVGLVKAVLALHHGELPPTLHFDGPNPHIDFARLAVVTRARPWPRYGGRITAGVSSFGFGGTNAHVVLEEATNPAPPPVCGPSVLVVPGATEERVRSYAARLADWITGRDLPAVATTLTRRRGDEPFAAVVSTEAGSVADQLRQNLQVENVRRGNDRLVFVFSGYGSGWAGMGRRLLEHEPVFAAAVDEVDRLVAPRSVRELINRLAKGLGDGQVVLFGIQVALARLWESRGVRASAVVGQSAGEVAAAVVSGALSLADAARVVTTRARLLDTIDGDGAMAAVELAPEEVDDPALCVAVHAAPRRCTVSGPEDRVRALVARVEAAGGSAKLLPLRTSGHSPAVEPVLPELVHELSGIEGAEPGIPFYGTVLADPRQRPPFTAAYWAAHLRQPVRFAQAVSAAVEDGLTTFLEVSPHPVALPAIAETAPDAVLVGTLRRDTDDLRTVHDNLLALHLHGAVPAAGGITDVPTAPWRHREHWTTPPTPSAGHPLLGVHVELPNGVHAWQSDVGLAAHPWLADHRVQGVPVFPAAGYVELALAAADVLDGPHEVRDIAFDRLLPLAEHVPITTTLTGRAVEVHAKDGDEWVRHATATLVPAQSPEPFDRVHSGQSVELYEVMGEAGMDYGPAFRTVLEARADDGVATCRMRPPDGPDRDLHLPPTLLDGCLHALAAAASATGLPTGIGAIRLHGDPRRAHTAEATTAGRAVRLFDADGGLLLEVLGVRAKQLTGLTVEHRWERADLPEGEHLPRTWLVDDDEIAAALVRAGHRVTDDPAGADGVVFVPRSLADDLHRLAEVRTGRLWVVTRGAVAFDGEAGVPDQAALRGAVRVMAFERPGLRASIVDVDDLDVLAWELAADEPDDEVAWRGGARYVARLRPVDLPEDFAVEPGSYLITGGLGALGRVTAGWLVERGATRVVLCGRSAREVPELSGGGAKVLGGGAEVVAGGAEVLGGGAEVLGGGVEVVVVAGDIAEPDTARRAVEAAVRGGERLRGVVHAAGVLVDEPLDRLTPGGVAAVLRPKVEGALRLAEATRDHRPWWVVFSSAAGLVGSPGQAAYATANAWLDAFTARLRAEGVRAASVQYGAWSGVGRAKDVRNPLLRPLSPAEGVRALEAVLASGRRATGVLRFDRGGVVELFPELGRRPFFSGFLAAGGSVDGRSVAAGSAEGRLAAVVARVLGHADVDPTVPLTSLGLDSLMAMRLRNAVEHEVGVSLPVPLLLKGASLDDVRGWAGEGGGTREGGGGGGEGRREGEGEGEGVASGPRHHSPTGDRQNRGSGGGVVERRGSDGGAAGPQGSSGGVVGPEGAGGGGVGPRDPVERWLVGLCGRVGVSVGVHGVVPGGVREALLGLMRERLGEVGAGVFDGEPTVERLAERVREAFAGSDGPITNLREGGAGVPLHLFHPAGGPTTVYRPLLELLDDRPAYGYERLDSVADIPGKARRYVELVRSVQPEGPYVLGGWSFGGCLAHEVACQLLDAGDQVELVVMIDTVRPLPAPDVSGAELVRHRFERFVAHVRETYGAAVELPWAELAGMDDVEQVDAVLRAMVRAGVGISEGALRHQRTSYLDARAAERFEPRYFPGRVVFYRAVERETLTTVLDPRYLRRQEDDDLGWADACGELEVVPVPGDHLSMVDLPHVAVLAEHLAKVLPQ
ncbi:type I polyketide synthase [Saccharothrix variisporea]|uniref:Phthiocerol/phenolphthiocerol synthesis type-I polyketide synthase D n=1 Tax=Saccharothrix variisporea TaxID=543527 RepID=A0A495X4A5_9PSEU|nr:type I polyketide synthase [Saccharothrix variisporea]RKT67463.1 phthiocerol/phenolphthiocerol synthesis type-I polyketide synthase D [Saccharothrix variisporea]